MPAIIIPIPLITRPQAHACRGLTDQLRQFLTSPDGYSSPAAAADARLAGLDRRAAESADSVAAGARAARSRLPAALGIGTACVTAGRH